MINSRKELREYIHQDSLRYGYNKKSIYYFHLLVGVENAKSFRFLKILRKCEYYGSRDNCVFKFLYLFFKLKKSILGTKYMIKIPENVVGPGLYITHLTGGGILLNANRIGRNCVCNSGVQLGMAKSPESKPVIGDNVVLCSGVKIYGDVHVGDNSIVLANAVVTKDIPANCTVAGVPAKIIDTK